MFFTVLMSVYKSEKADYFKSALKSIADQSLLPEQLVLVCDGPLTPELDEVVNNYGLKFSRLGVDYKVLRLSLNVGLGLALANGSGLCEGKYIVRMDSDDISCSTRIEELYDAIKLNPNYDVIGAQVEEFFVSPGDYQKFRIVPLSHVKIARYSKIRNPLNHVTACIKRQSLVDVGGYENVLGHEDYFLWVKMIQSGKMLMNLDGVHVNVRVNGLTSRRAGFRYIKHELGFLKKCVSLNHMNLFDVSCYLLPRFVIRLLPSNLLSVVYRYLRTGPKKVSW